VLRPAVASRLKEQCQMYRRIEGEGFGSPRWGWLFGRRESVQLGRKKNKNSHPHEKKTKRTKRSTTERINTMGGKSEKRLASAGIRLTHQL